MVKLLNKIQPQVNACYTSEYGRTLIKQKSDADEIRKAALDTYLSQEAKLESNGAGSTKPDIELSKRVCRAILKMIKCYESSQSKDDNKDTTYVPDVESETATLLPREMKMSRRSRTPATNYSIQST